jgi:hypothetical protein
MKIPIIIAAFIGLILGSSIGGGVAKLTQPEIPACPTCPACPPATEVKFQELDLENLRKLKGDLHYAPQLSNVVVKIDCKDSVLLKQLLRK